MEAIDYALAIHPTESTNAPFDYELVDSAHRQRVKDLAVEIQGHSRTAASNIFAMGKGLLTAKELLPHGQFGQWVEREFHLSQRTATNMMNAARHYGDKSEIVSDLPTAIIYMLSAPSTSPTVREVVELQIMQTGQAPATKEITVIRNSVLKVIFVHIPPTSE